MSSAHNRASRISTVNPAAAEQLANLAANEQALRNRVIEAIPDPTEEQLIAIMSGKNFYCLLAEKKKTLAKYRTCPCPLCVCTCSNAIMEGGKADLTLAHLVKESERAATTRENYSDLTDNAVAAIDFTKDLIGYTQDIVGTVIENTTVNIPLSTKKKKKNVTFQPIEQKAIERMALGITRNSKDSLGNNNAFRQGVEKQLGKPSPNILGMDGKVLDARKYISSSTSDHRIKTNNLKATDGGAELLKATKVTKPSLYVDAEYKKKL